MEIVLQKFHSIVLCFEHRRGHITILKHYNESKKSFEQSSPFLALH